MKTCMRRWWLWSGSENFNIPTPLRRALKIHHMSSVENASFNPTPVPPHISQDPHLRPICRRLTYNSSNDVDASDDEATTSHIHSLIAGHSVVSIIPDHDPTLILLYIYTETKKVTLRRISKLYHWMMNIQWLNRFLTDHYAYMIIYPCMNFAHSCAPMQITWHLPTQMPWIGVIFPNLRTLWSLPVMRTFLILRTKKL